MVPNLLLMWKSLTDFFSHKFSAYNTYPFMKTIVLLPLFVILSFQKVDVYIMVNCCLPNFPWTFWKQSVGFKSTGFLFFFFSFFFLSSILTFFFFLVKKGNMYLFKIRKMWVHVLLHLISVKKMLVSYQHCSVIEP